jgi:hypothetical protein
MVFDTPNADVFYLWAEPLAFTMTVISPKLHRQQAGIALIIGTIVTFPGTPY